MYEGSRVEQEIRRAVAALVKAHGQERVARAIGVSQPTVSRYLSGRAALSLTLAVGLVRAYPELRPLVELLLYGDDEEELARMVVAS